MDEAEAAQDEDQDEDDEEDDDFATRTRPRRGQDEAAKTRDDRTRTSRTTARRPRSVAGEPPGWTSGIALERAGLTRGERMIQAYGEETGTANGGLHVEYRDRRHGRRGIARWCRSFSRSGAVAGAKDWKTRRERMREKRRERRDERRPRKKTGDKVGDKAGAPVNQAGPRSSVRPRRGGTTRPRGRAAVQARAPARRRGGPGPPGLRVLASI